MKEVFTVFVSGHPKGQPRPRGFKTPSGQVRVYDPKTAEGWKGQIAMALKPLIPLEPIQDPVRVDITFFMPRPKIHYGTGRNAKKLKPSAPSWFDKKPDRDNLDKVVLDVLTDLQIINDDALVCDGRIVKKYHFSPGCRITVFYLENSDIFATDCPGSYDPRQ